MRFRWVILVFIIAWNATGFAAQEIPATARSREVHQNLLIAADPYLSADRYKAPFGKHSPFEAGIVAIDIYFRNDNDSPVRINLDNIRLVVSRPGEDRQRLSPLPPEEVADRSMLKAHANPSLPRPSLPFPTGSKSGKGKGWDEMAATLHSVVLSTELLPPHATTHGFLFFDMNRNFDAIRQSTVYIPDLYFMTDKKALFFFEIELGATSANQDPIQPAR